MASVFIEEVSKVTRKRSGGGANAQQT